MRFIVHRMGGLVVEHQDMSYTPYIYIYIYIGLTNKEGGKGLNYQGKGRELVLL